MDRPDLVEDDEARAVARTEAGEAVVLIVPAGQAGPAGDRPPALLVAGDDPAADRAAAAEMAGELAGGRVAGAPGAAGPGAA